MVRIFRFVLSWILYQIGDLTSRIGHKFDPYIVWEIYQRAMRWSMRLDKEGKIWKFVEEDLDK